MEFSEQKEYPGQTEYPGQMEYPEAEKPKPKKGKLAIVLGAVALVLVAALLLSWNSLGGLFASMKSPEEYLAYVEEKAQADGSAMELTSGMYASFYESMTETKENSAEGAVFLTVGEELTDLLEQYLAAGVELDWLKQISLNTTFNNADTLKGINAVLGLNGKPVLSADAMLDMESFDIYAGAPELNKTYLHASLTDMGVDKQMVDSTLDEMTALQEKLTKLLPDQQELEAMIGKYTDLIVAGQENVEKTKQSVTINGITQELTVLQSRLSEQNLKKIALAVLAEAKNDQGILDLLNAAQMIAVMGEGETAEDLTLDEYKQMIDELIAQLEGEAATDDVVFVLKTYVDNKHNICGRSGTDPEGEEEISSLTVSDGDKWAYEMKVYGEVMLSGSGSSDKKLLSGTYTFWESGEEMLSVEVAQLDLPAMREGELLGTLLLRPGQIILDEIAAEAGAPAALVSNIAMEIKLAAETCDINILNGDKLLLGLGITAALKELEALTPPENTVEIADGAALEQWLGQLDLQGVLDALQEAGVPEDYMGLLQGITAG